MSRCGRSDGRTSPRLSRDLGQRRTSAGRQSLTLTSRSAGAGGAGDVGGDDVGGVAVQRTAGAVVATPVCVKAHFRGRVDGQAGMARGRG